MSRTSTNAKLSDAEAKRILLKTWHERPTLLWDSPNNGSWLRALPKSGNSTVPCLKSPGSTDFKTQPDGLYVCVHEGKFADIIVIEVCGTQQNLNDKRSRYSPNLSSLMLYMPVKWFGETVSGKGKSQSPRWRLCEGINNMPDNPIEIPVRHLRVLYAIPNDILKKWRVSHSPLGHEFFCRHSSLRTINNQSMREFLSRMSVKNHFYGTS